MILHTETGSIYEFDTENKKVRRLHGKGAPTSYQGSDNEWKDYMTVDLLSDNTVLIIWKYTDGIASTTRTSRVVKTDMDDNVVN